MRYVPPLLIFVRGFFCKIWLIAFESQKKFHVERYYSIVEQGLTGVVHALRTWCCYLVGADCLVVTDHNVLTYLKSQQTLSRCEAQWIEYFEQNFTHKWEYRLKHIYIANSLSCRFLEHNDPLHVLSQDSLGCRDVKLNWLWLILCWASKRWL